jgi:hypothetical protein
LRASREDVVTLSNRYGVTAARPQARPGRETRPRSITVDIHAHVMVPEAAAFVQPHLDLSTHSADCVRNP